MHDLITLCGGENVFTDATGRYPETTLEDVAQRSPDVVLLPDEPFRFGKRHLPEVIETLPNARIHLVDGKLMCWYGPRIPEAYGCSAPAAARRSPAVRCDPVGFALSWIVRGVSSAPSKVKNNC
jgi:ABC-type hemin transport system substrate-binding protein